MYREEMGRSFLSRRASLLCPSTIVHLSQLAQKCNAINLAEGFPDFPAPQPFKDAAISAIRSNFNQYRHVQGVCDKVAAAFGDAQGLKVNPYTQVTICCGQSEALMAAMLAVINEGDEVVLLDPSYETYEASIILAGGKAVSLLEDVQLSESVGVGTKESFCRLRANAILSYRDIKRKTNELDEILLKVASGHHFSKHVSMVPPHWALDLKKLESVMGSQTKALILNSPHNPTGKVFNQAELEGIAKLCCQYDCLAITDEVYEHILFTGAKHVSLASFPGMQERTIVTSSLSKTFSVTGWRIGWAIAPEVISSAISTIHGKLTDSAPAPFQEAAVFALESTPEYFVNLKKEYVRRRDFVCEMLEEAGFNVRFKPEGSFFVFAHIPPSSRRTDVEYVAELIRIAGVAIVPGCGFFHAEDSAHEEYRSLYVRVAFCKDMKTLSAARQALTTHCKHIH